jgi:hypothetical protein
MGEASSVNLILAAGEPPDCDSHATAAARKTLAKSLQAIAARAAATPGGTFWSAQVTIQY